jgi:hypothetical protein
MTDVAFNARMPGTEDAGRGSAVPTSTYRDGGSAADEQILQRQSYVEQGKSGCNLPRGARWVLGEKALTPSWGYW